ncbi:hypothetical protein F4778DRAFT_732818 [Xylariomycetidae sp. FL2044]|nr:hypothetical protein F4778DRAFT_732818 [Xylariomycetidae sp. FL2044]
MVIFSRMNFYAIPSLPGGWSAPEWLRTEVGFFAGRLYFEWDEYPSICRLLGIDQSVPALEELEISGSEPTEPGTSTVGESSTQSDPPSIEEDKRERRKAASRLSSSHIGALTPKPYTFTQGFLSVRRQGQDFSHTPMGSIVTGKSLHQDHSFFRQRDTSRYAKAMALADSSQNCEGQNDDAAGESMDAGEHDPSAEIRGDVEVAKIEYDESEMYQEEDSESASSSDSSEPASKRKGKGRGKGKSK